MKYTTIETNDELQSLLLSAHTYLKTPISQRQKVGRPGPGVKWYRDIARNGIGKRCPTCNVKMGKSRFKNDPNAATREHIVPLNLGGDHKTSGDFPNCIAMCHGCNQARNNVVNMFNKTVNQTMGVVKFLIEQVYCKGVKLVEKYVKPFRRSLRYHKSKKPRKSNPIRPVSFPEPNRMKNETIAHSSQYDLTLYSSVKALRESFDLVWKKEQVVHFSHLHPSVRKGWFPEKAGKERIESRPKGQVKRWMDLYLSGTISQLIFLNQFRLA